MEKLTDIQAEEVLALFRDLRSVMERSIALDAIAKPFGGEETREEALRNVPPFYRKRISEQLQQIDKIAAENPNL